MTGAPPEARNLTDLLRFLPIPSRLKARRRIEAIADHWRLFLRAKYGDQDAIIRCRGKLIYCTKHARGLRWHIWTIVWQGLRPPQR